MPKTKSFYRAEKVEALRNLKKFYKDDVEGCADHIPQVCAIDGCPNESSKWIETGGMKFKGAKGGTLYLCSDCAGQLYINGDDGEGIGLIDPRTMELLTFEVAEYCCGDDCNECNN